MFDSEFSAAGGPAHRRGVRRRHPAAGRDRRRGARGEPRRLRQGGHRHRVPPPLDGSTEHATPRLTNAWSHAGWVEIATTLACSTTTAAHQVELGVALRDRLPRTRAAFAAGEIDYAKAWRLATATDGFSDAATAAAETAALGFAHRHAPAGFATAVEDVLIRLAPDEYAQLRKDAAGAGAAGTAPQTRADGPHRGRPVPAGSRRGVAAAARGRRHRVRPRPPRRPAAPGGRLPRAQAVPLRLPPRTRDQPGSCAPPALPGTAIRGPDPAATATSPCPPADSPPSPPPTSTPATKTTTASPTTVMAHHLG